MNELAVKYNIRSKETVRRWINNYIESKEIKNYIPNPEVYRMNAKKTTFKERIEIVKYCLAHDMNYKDAAEKFEVKYSQVYNWVQKYKKHGSDGLVDSRGKGKPKQIMTPEEVSKAHIKALEERNNYLEMENEVLKKEDQIERQLMNQESGKKPRTKRLKR